jgi:hypothetical protein
MAAKRYLMRRRGFGLAPTDQESQEIIGKLTIDSDYAVSIYRIRNTDAHKKAFAYLKLTFEYWEPKKFVEQIEIETVDKLRQFLIKAGGNEPAITNLSRQFLKHLNQQRAGMPQQKNFEYFREWVTIEAGFYSEFHTPSGPRKVAKSWAFVNMSQEEFEKLWTGIRNVCWDMVLKTVFQDQEEAEQAALMLLDFD